MATKGMPTCYPQGCAWQTLIANAKVATTNPYIPSAAANTVHMNVVGYSRAIFRIQYVATVTTDAVIAAWGLREGETKWESLYTVQATPSLTITTVDVIATDCYDGALYYYSHSQYPVDIRGCREILITCITAAVSAGGAVALEGAAY